MKQALSLFLLVLTACAALPSEAETSARCAGERLGARSQVALAYAPDLGGVLLFGGVSDDEANRFPRSLWRWDGMQWSCVNADGPPGRMDAFMDYDSGRKRLVLFGGRSESGGDVSMLIDTWEWDGETWTLVDAAGPGPRIHGAIAYDARRGAIVVHGGAGEESLRDDTWQWDGAAWRGVPLALPFAGNGNSLIPTDRGMLMLAAVRDSEACGELTRAAILVIEGSEVRAVNGAGPCFSQQAPAAATRTGLLLYSGWLPNAASAEAWIWEQGDWRRTEAPPPRRRGAAAAYDAGRDRVVLFGGNTSAGLLGDTWEWDGAGWENILPSP